LQGHSQDAAPGSESVAGWDMTLLQANQPERTWSGGSHALLHSDPVVFGLDGVVAVRVSPFGKPGSAAPYELRASSKLPAGFTHPKASEPMYLTDGFEIPRIFVPTWLRPGLELRIKVHFYPTHGPVSAAPGEKLDFAPQVAVTPPTGAGEPWIDALDGP